MYKDQILRGGRKTVQPERFYTATAVFHFFSLSVWAKLNKCNQEED